jgi:hypothetical protein
MLPQLRTLDEVNVSVKAQARHSEENAMHSCVEPPIERPRAHPSNGAKRIARNSHDFSSKKGFNGQMFTGAYIKPSSPPLSHIAAVRADDSNMLAAVLALIPELTTNSFQIVLEAIQDRCG